MPRSLQCVVAIAALTAAAPALAADYNEFPGLRPSYPDSWENGDDNPLRFEAGVRYWYSLGQMKMSIAGDEESVDTKTHSGEAFVHIDDNSTSTFVEATAGYGFAHDGTYSFNGGPDVTLPAARLGYVGADFGWLPFGDASSGFGLGAVAGYQYTNDSPDTGRANFTTSESVDDINWSENTGVWGVGADSETNDFNIHEAKLGLAARADMGGFDVTGQATVTPYAWVTGTYGAAAMAPQGPFNGGPGGATQLQASTTTINGFAYGAGGKLMVGFHPTDNFTIRLGGKASYLQGQYDATWDEATITHPTANPPVPDPDNPGAFIPADPLYSAPSMSRQTHIVDNNPFSMFRYGALVEISGRF